MYKARNTHLEEMLTEVHIAVKNHNEYKLYEGKREVNTQITQHTNRGFTKQLYFNPGIYFDENDQMIMKGQEDQFLQDNNAKPVPSTSRPSNRRQIGDNAI